MPLKTSLLFSVLCAASLSACAQAPSSDAAQSGDNAEATTPTPIETRPGTPEDRARQAIESINPEIQIDAIAAAPLPGFREVVVGGQTVYVSDDGKYLLQGSLFDVEAKRDVGQAGVAEVRRKLIAGVPASDRIVFAPPNPKYTVSVFTDVECGYCRKLHQDIAEYNKRGIAVEYLAFPRMGLNTPDYDLMVSVWCAPDRRKALTDAKDGNRVPPRTCDNPVAQQYALGQRVGLTGTPMIVTASGVQMPGYMPPDALLSALQQVEAAGGG
ncbi:thioredoxin fold domain-containing protein [Luteimonas kalidii]|uniref:Thiol:disulfide interchange protein n=1 Tax=Luteimonas kalidii TaxID=3042025 RepID=A0ABT6JYG3_9GAMM|nr:thioredoxin fold domain-containing protein [Luteimonas kalidii]MDH5835734.1 thioredoxin fold domain-containing protein [Luteimonas kalidii]